QLMPQSPSHANWAKQVSAAMSWASRPMRIAENFDVAALFMDVLVSSTSAEAREPANSGRVLPLPGINARMASQVAGDLRRFLSPADVCRDRAFPRQSHPGSQRG